MDPLTVDVFVAAGTVCFVIVLLIIGILSE